MKEPAKAQATLKLGTPTKRIRQEAGVESRLANWASWTVQRGGLIPLFQPSS